MTRVMMMLGAFPFMLDTAAYQQLRRRTEWRWEQMDRIGRDPAQQYLGPGTDRITLQGEILPHWKGGYRQIDLMRAQAGRGRPLVLIEGYGGIVLGSWVIVKIEETKAELMGDGSPRIIGFQVELRAYGGDGAGMSGLGLGLAALSALARLI